MKFSTAVLLLAGLPAGVLAESTRDAGATMARTEATDRRDAQADVATLRKRCRAGISHSRALPVRPGLDRTPAQPGEPPVYYAVDRRLDGCGVLVPVGDPTEMRESPPPGQPAFRPIRPGG